MKVAVIGGGASGLATARFLVHAHEYFGIDPIEVRLFEAGPTIGGTFVDRVYEDAELVSSKYLTAFSDFRLPEDAPDFLTPQRYVQYLRDYATNFDLWDVIELSTRVESVRPIVSGHVVKIVSSEDKEEVEEWACDAVAVCSGLHLNPYIPDIPGLDKVPTVLHSSQVKTRVQFGEGTNVVVMGAGETGMDMAHLAVTSPTSSVALCHQAGFFCAPKIIPLPGPAHKRSVEAARRNKPVDTSVASLFDTAYAHPILQRSQLLWFAYDQWIKKMHTLISGTEEGPDQWVGHMSKERKHVDSLFMVKSDRAIPYMSEGHRSKSWWNKKRTQFLNVPIKETYGRKIDVLSFPKVIGQDGFITVHDDHGNIKRIKPDIIVMATGYRTEFPFLDAEYPTLAETNIRCIYNERDVTLGYIGFVRPNLGAIPPLAEMQAQLWVLRLLQLHPSTKVPVTRDTNAVSHYELDWKIHARAGYDLFTKKRAVEHESYAYQLALDMGSAPTITHVWSKGWKIFFTWAMGSNFNPKFRMIGPWKSPSYAEHIMSNELFNVVKRSGGTVYLVTYTIIPFILFGTLSTSLYAICGLLSPLNRLFLAAEKFVRRIFGSKSHSREALVEEAAAKDVD
jgi:dimethylaniline monooxygenase (N-oxide forming)